MQVFNTDGTFLFAFGRQGVRDGEFNYPWDVAVNSLCQIVVTDSRNFRIQMFESDGRFLRKYEFGNIKSKTQPSPRGICFTPGGSILTSDFINHRIIILDSTLQEAKYFGAEGQLLGEFVRPQVRHVY